MTRKRQMSLEYKCIAAPEEAKRRGCKRSERLALNMQDIINDQAAEGWQYLRTDTVPIRERRGFFGGTDTISRSVMVFCRALASNSDQVELSAPGGESARPSLAPSVSEPHGPPPSASQSQLVATRSPDAVQSGDRSGEQEFPRFESFHSTGAAERREEPTALPRSRGLFRISGGSTAAAEDERIEPDSPVDRR